MANSQSAVNRLLDLANPSVTPSTLERPVHALGKKLTVQELIGYQLIKLKVSEVIAI